MMVKVLGTPMEEEAVEEGEVVGEGEVVVVKNNDSKRALA